VGPLEVDRRTIKGMLTGALVAAALLSAGCSSSVVTNAPPSSTSTTSGPSSTTTRVNSSGTSTSVPVTRSLTVGLCTFAGAIPYPRITADGAPDVSTELGIPLASSASSPMLATAYHQFNTMRCTHYQHHDLPDPSAATYYYDCVGFTSYTLRVAAPLAWGSLVADVHLQAGRVPSPKLYDAFFNRLATKPRPGWSPVTTAASVLPGDLLAWSPSAEDTGSAGHSVMALSTPLSLGGGRFALVAMDSTATGHGPDDTRRDSNPLSARNAPLGVLHGRSSTHRAGFGARSGLGIGVIALDTGPNGAVTGVEWTIGTPVEQVSFASARPLPS
jgi:hypothetical protein